MIDAAIVGRALGADALASVGASSSVQFLVLGFCIGIACGFGIPIAKSFGGGNLKEMRSHIFHSIFLTAVFAVVLTVICALLCPQILQLLSTPGEIYKDAYRYLLVLFLGIPFTLLYNLTSSILRSVGDSKTPFVFLAVSTVLNIILDLLCIMVFGWGCAGAAIATVTAQAVSGILCSIYIWKKVPVLKLTKKDCRLKKRGVRIMLTMGVPMGLQYSITAIGSMVIQYANNSLGNVVYVSAFAASARLKQFFMCPFDAVATGVSVFCSQNLGAGKKKRIRRGLFQGVCVDVAYGAVAGIMLIFAGRLLCQLFVSGSETEVLDAAATYLFCQGFFFWSLGILNVCRMTTQGLGYSGRAVFSGVMEMIARIVVGVAFVPVYGYTAICFADQAAWIAACVYILPVCLHCLKKIDRAYVGNE
jgi:putative MATE family efflux protein